MHIIGSNITCYLMITNTTEDDKDFKVIYGWHYKTMIFDESGNEHVISQVKLANQVGKMKGITQYETASKKIVAGTTVPCELQFDKISSQAQQISLLQILCGNKGEKIEFRNIDLQ